MVIVHTVSICVSYIIFFFASSAALLYLIQDNNLKHKHLGPIFSRLPDLSLLDKINYKAIGIGFPILTAAIASGMLWSKDIYGVYWVWNSRDIYSVVLWLLYALILHVRLAAKLRGRKVAILSLIAFSVIVFTLFTACGVNI